MVKKLKQKIVALWYQEKLAVPLWVLVPFSFLFQLITGIRKQLFYWRIKKSWRAPVPVIVVGNITVGGTGKTPTVLALIHILKAMGLKPGVVSRGYGGQGPFPMSVDENSLAKNCGDEPLLIAQLAQVPVAVSPKRVEAVQHLLAHHQVDLILLDDGLQHLALKRDLEICLIDGARGLGNNWLLPCGPLREKPERLKDFDWCLMQDTQDETKNKKNHPVRLKKSALHTSVYKMKLQIAGWKRVIDNRDIIPPDAEVATAIAGIANPERFFAMVQQQGILLSETRVFPDHYAYQPQDFSELGIKTPILMTEKDAVKVRDFAQPHWYYLKVEMILPACFIEAFQKRVTKLIKKRV